MPAQDEGAGCRRAQAVELQRAEVRRQGFQDVLCAVEECFALKLGAGERLAGFILRHREKGEACAVVSPWQEGCKEGRATMRNIPCKAYRQ